MIEVAVGRPLRIEFSGALYRLTSRGDRREALYEDGEDRQRSSDMLAEVVERYNWICHAYCVMSNHNRVGHVFQGRYKAVLVEKQSYLLELARYIVLNPVRAQLVRSARDWPWSSYRATAGQSAGPNCLQTDWILAAFGKRKQQAIDGYKRFVAEGKGQPSPWQELAHQVYLGSEAFIEKVQSHLDLDKDLDEIPSSQKRPAARPLEEYQTKYKSRNAAIFEAYRSGGYTLKDIGRHFGLHNSTVSGIIKNHKLKT